MQQYIGFHLQKSEYAIPITKVREIINLPEITRLPQSSPTLTGITNLRGSVIPVVNVKRLMHLAENGNKGSKIIVIASGRITYGILVDSITGVIGIDESAIESPENLAQGRTEQVNGVAKYSDRLIMLLDPKKLIPLEDMGLLEDAAAVEGGNAAGPCGTAQTLGEKELHDARRFFEKRTVDPADPRLALFNDMIKFMEAIAAQDYGAADHAMQTIVKESQGDLFKEVGKVTRKLHDAVKSFKDAIDPRIKGLATTDMPNAVDQLRFVIDKTEEAAHKTMSVVEKYILRMDDLSGHIRKVQAPAETVQYLKQFKNELEDDLTLVLTTQSFQDLTGQTIKKVIDLVRDIETELVTLIATFGVKVEVGAAPSPPLPEKISQADVDDLLKGFGF